MKKMYIKICLSLSCECRALATVSVNVLKYIRKDKEDHLSFVCKSDFHSPTVFLSLPLSFSFFFSILFYFLLGCMFKASKVAVGTVAVLMLFLCPKNYSHCHYRICKGYAPQKIGLHD